MTTVAFLGLGRMGVPMAARLAAAGFELTVWNRSPAKAAAFAAEHGARVADTPARAAREADVVVSMLADDDAVTAAHTGPDGSCTTARPGTVLVDMSTVAPGTSLALAAAARARGLAFLDAPVSGSTAAAAAGTLTIMAAGDAVAVATAEPVFRALGSHLVHLGDTGAGTAMKLVVNTVVHALNNAVSEALVLAERAGIERAVAYDVFRHSAIAAPFVQYRQAAFERPEETPVASRLELAVKDLRLALELAERTGTDLPQAGANIAIMRDAVRAGYGDHDESGVAEHLRASAAARDTAPDAPRETARETARDAARPPER